MNKPTSGELHDSQIQALIVNLVFSVLRLSQMMESALAIPPLLSRPPIQS